MKYLLALKNEALANTDWFNASKKYVGALLPNFFILYFGQKTPSGDIMSDNVKMAFSTIGTGYKTWCTLESEAINSSCKIATALNNAAGKAGYDHTAIVQKYFDEHWTGKEMELAAEGPTLPIILALSDVFPVKAADIKKDYLGQPPSLAGHPGISTFTIQHPGELGQEAEAQKGVAKLTLLDIGHSSTSLE